MNISTYRAHHFLVLHLRRRMQDACDLFVRMPVTIEDPNSIMSANEIEKRHLEAHNTAPMHHRRAMSKFITYYALNLTDEDFVPEIIFPDFFDCPLPEKYTEPRYVLFLSEYCGESIS